MTVLLEFNFLVFNPFKLQKVDENRGNLVKVQNN